MKSVTLHKFLLNNGYRIECEFSNQIKARINDSFITITKSKKWKLEIVDFASVNVGRRRECEGSLNEIIQVLSEANV